MRIRIFPVSPDQANETDIVDIFQTKYAILYHSGENWNV